MTLDLNPILTKPVLDTSADMSRNGTIESIILDRPALSQHSLLSYLQLFWAERKLILRLALCAILASTLIAVLIPSRYEAVTRLMPPDARSGSGLGLMAALATRGGSGVEALAGDLLGTKTSGALFIGVLNSETAQDAIIDKFQLQRVY